MAKQKQKPERTRENKAIEKAPENKAVPKKRKPPVKDKRGIGGYGRKT